MKPNESSSERAVSRTRIWWWCAGVAGLGLVMFLLWPNAEVGTEPGDAFRHGKGARSGAGQGPAVGEQPVPSRTRSRPAAANAQAIVAEKLTQFGRSRRELAHALAQRHNVAVPAAVEQFFDAIESGDWEQIEARFKAISGSDSSAGQGPMRAAEVNRLWPAIIDAYGAAEQAHEWPPQQLLDYGRGILDSLRPGMVYIGGTDHGRWIPALLNDTAEGERHTVITQNGLADATYLDYVQLLYGDRVATLTSDDSQTAFKDYIADAERRLKHDLQLPNEPKQVRAGENIRSADGRIEVSGQVAVMSINEKLLQRFMEKNPDLTFALEESFPLKSTYAQAAPLGPIMELKTQDQTGFDTARAAQSVEYWRDKARQLFGDPAAVASETVLKSHSHDAASAANLLAAHNYHTEAEEAYRLAQQLAPSNREAVTGLSEILMRTARAEEAKRLADEFVRQYPEQQHHIDLWRASIRP